MPSFRNSLVAGCCLAALVGAGCVKKPLVVQPPVVVAPAVSPVIGVWENSVRGESRGRMIFKPGGELTFQGGMEFYNPARWEHDTARQELVLSLPQAPNEKLDIFKMYIGDGVKAFDRQKKQITYAFSDQTGSLNIGGWIYSKREETNIPNVPEPTLK